MQSTVNREDKLIGKKENLNPAPYIKGKDEAERYYKLKGIMNYLQQKYIDNPDVRLVGLTSTNSLGNNKEVTQRVLKRLPSYPEIELDIDIINISKNGKKDDFVAIENYDSVSFDVDELMNDPLYKEQIAYKDSVRSLSKVLKESPELFPNGVNIEPKTVYEASKAQDKRKELLGTAFKTLDAFILHNCKANSNTTPYLEAKRIINSYKEGLEINEGFILARLTQPENKASTDRLFRKKEKRTSESLNNYISQMDSQTSFSRVERCVSRQIDTNKTYRNLIIAGIRNMPVSLKVEAKKMLLGVGKAIYIKNIVETKIDNFDRSLSEKDNFIKELKEMDLNVQNRSIEF